MRRRAEHNDELAFVQDDVLRGLGIGFALGVWGWAVIWLVLCSAAGGAQ